MNTFEERINRICAAQLSWCQALIVYRIEAVSVLRHVMQFDFLAASLLALRLPSFPACWPYGSLALCLSGTPASWFSGSLAFWFPGSLFSWLAGFLASRLPALWLT